MKQTLQITAGLVLMSALLTACSDSNDTAVVEEDGGSTAGESTAGESTAGESTAGESTAGESTAGESTAGESTAGESTGGESTAGESTAGESTGGESTGGESTGGESTGGESTGGESTGGESTGGESTTGSTTGEGGDTGASGGTTTGGSLDDAPNNGVDLSGGDDDSPTATESLSLQGPFIRDESRPAGAPSAPTGLTPLLIAENWVKFTWAPSADDQAVSSYEVYRDGNLVHTIDPQSENEFDYRSWLGTSYTDCNFTRYTFCEFDAPVTGGQHSYTVVAVDNEGNKSAPSEPAVIQLNSIQDTSVDTSNMNLVFEDDFDGDALDVDRWKTVLPWGEDQVINGEMQHFVNIFGANPMDYTPFEFTGETLQITGRPTPSELSAEANGQPYLSGVITTADKFSMTYGYVEMRARLTQGQGLLSTFYLFNQDFERNAPEIDIAEYIGDRPDKVYQTYHYYDSNRARYATGEKNSSPTMEYVAGTDLSADFHTFSVMWQEGLVIWYVDGVEVRRLTGPRVSDEPMNIIAQLVVGSEWIGTPDPSAIPAVLEIDYIRAWQ